MAYDLNDVVRFANTVARAYEGKKNRGHDVSEQAKADWGAHLLALNKTLDDVNEHSPSKHKLAWHALALENAAVYLSVKTTSGEAITAEEQQVLKKHVDQIAKALPRTFPKLKIEVPVDPTDIFEPPAEIESLPKKSQKKDKKKDKREEDIEEEPKQTILTKCPQVIKFLESEEFQALERYQSDVLTNDKRSHQYLCYFDLSERRKADVLNELLMDLKGQQNMDGISKVLRNFYNGKNQQVYNKETAAFDKSPYEILNLGQNITTRFFNRFGMRSTTITLLDNLAATVEMGSKAEVVKAPSMA